MAASDARPFPLKNTAYRMPVSFRKTDGTLITSWAGMDTQVSLDGANYAAATNEATEIQTSGTGYVDLTSAEMNADMVWVKITVTNTDALPVAVALLPQDVADLAQTADAIWDAVSADHVDAGSTGEALANAGGGSSPADIADAVWDELLAGHVGAGSAGEALSAAGSAGDPWITALPGAYGAGTAGNILGNPLAVASLAANSVTASALATDAVAEIADGVWDELLAGHVTAGSAGLALADAADEDSPATIATAVWDLTDGIEPDWTPRQTMRVIAAATAGVNSGNETNTPNYRNLPNTKGRISATLDDSQNRTAVTYDPD